MLVEKGLALPSLLSTYSEERLPVIKRMVEENLKIFKASTATSETRPVQGEAPREGGDNDSQEASQRREKHLNQLGINYRWSSSVLDERTGAQENKGGHDAYGKEAGPTLRAGDRAPEAPELMVVGGGDQTSLFKIIAPTHHMVLVFAPTTDAAKPILERVKSYPQGAVVSAVILPHQAAAAAAYESIQADFLLKDKGGHAYAAYGCAVDAPTVVIVRPDGVVGAVVLGEEGVGKYFKGVFSAI